MLIIFNLLLNIIFRTVVSALHVWLDSYPEDFYDPPLHTCLRCLHSFTSTYLPKTDLHIRATYRLERFVKESKTLGWPIFNHFYFYIKLIPKYF